MSYHPTFLRLTSLRLNVVHNLISAQRLVSSTGMETHHLRTIQGYFEREIIHQ